VRHLLLLLSLLLIACGGPGPEPDPDPTPGEACVTEGITECFDNVHRTCTEGEWVINEVCASPLPQCSVSIGCSECGAGQEYCVGNAVFQCNGDGTDWSQIEDCGDSSCRWGDCYDLCSLAAETGSYLGCEFLAVPTSNSLLMGFDDDFAVVVGNPDEEREAQIQIVQGGDVITTSVLPAQGTRAYTLPYVPELKTNVASVVVPASAYEILSSIPVVAYQYNPLNFEAGGGTFSYTNDASLLLPVAALGQTHLVSAWPSFGIIEGAGWTWSPGFVAVTAPEDDTQVTITASSYTLGGVAVAAMDPGNAQTITLNRGDVLQVFSETGNQSCTAVNGTYGDAIIQDTSFPVCLNSERGDLTGSWVESNKPVAVFAGHDCTFVPLDRWACDHLEESMLPLEVWGTDAVIASPVMPGGNGVAPTLVRIIAQQDGTMLNFTPPVHEPVEAGPFTPVELMVSEDVMVSADTPILVMQFLIGEQALGTFAGDPAMGTVPPTNHWRSSYDFLVPETYEADYVNIVARFGANVYLDGVEILDWLILEETPYKVHRAAVGRGPHNVFSDGASPFGLTAYGYASYTSYLYPGGLDLTHNPQP